MWKIPRNITCSHCKNYVYLENCNDEHKTLEEYREAIKSKIHEYDWVYDSIWAYLCPDCQKNIRRKGY